MVEPFRPRPAVRPRAAAGFTLTEVMVTLAIFAIVIVAMLAIFDINGRIARVEGHVTDMQQALRIAQSDMIRIVRMGARGALPAALYAFNDPDTGYNFLGRFLPTGVAVEVANNVPANQLIADNDAAPVLQGTDILTIRGVFSTTVYQVEADENNGNLVLTDDDDDDYPDKGELHLTNMTPENVAAQDLQSLADAIRERRPEALLLVSPAAELCAVVELDPDESTFDMVDGVVTQAKIVFNAAGTEHSDSYKNLSAVGRFPKDMKKVVSVGILEEYKYYIRDPRPLNAANVTALEPVLARARLYPGTNIPYDNNVANLREEIADNVFDLQVALGIDANRDLILTEGTDAASRKVDEWLFNESGDDAAATASWNGTSATPTRLFYLRLSTLVRTAGRDPQPQWQAPALGRFEDKDYTQAPFNLFNTATERKFRRQSLQTVVDLRNLS